MGADQQDDAEPRPSLTEIFKPWEILGESRRDCVSDRAVLLKWLAWASLLLSGLNATCLPFWLLALPLALVTRAMARHDLELVSCGEMDQRGYEATEGARNESAAAVRMNVVYAAGWLLLAAGVLYGVWVGLL
jgi:hypothetical protein